MATISVPLGVQKAARKGLELRKEYGRGGTEVGERTARRLVSGRVEEGFVKHIAEYFPRHEGDRLDKKDPPSNGWIAWLLWGGDEGRRWSERIRDMASTARKGVRGGRGVNPGTFEKVVEVSKGFHGRQPKEVVRIDEVYRDRKNLATIGELEELFVIESVGDNEGIPLTFDYDDDEPVMVACTPDRGQILLVGGNQSIDPEDLELSEEEENKDYINLGLVFSITYWADKHHLVGSTGKREPYEHEFDGEDEDGGKIPLEDRILPVLMYDRLNEKLVLVGGRYIVKDEGIAG